MPSQTASAGGVADAKTFAPLVFLAGRRAYKPQPDANDPSAGLFFSLVARNLQVADYRLMCHLQASEDLVSAGETLVTIECMDRRRLDGPPLASVSLPLHAAVSRRGDPAILDFSLSEPARVTIRGRVSQGLGRVHLRQAELYAVGSGQLVKPARMPREYVSWPRDTARGLLIGTNGSCNASCPSCPTGKLVREGVPTGLMPMSLFRSIIDAVAEGQVTLHKNKVGLGLFGEPLMDPLMPERVRYIRERLPNLRILLNTNAGPFNERRHADLVKMVDMIGVHVEAHSPELYGELMAPLKSEIVFPKIERLIQLKPRRVRIACPISRRNAHEFAQVRDHWMAKGARAVTALNYRSRTTESLGFYDHAFAPTPTACTPAITLDLVIDWDGTVLGCCQDFMRREPLADLKTMTLRQALTSEPRRQMARKLGQRRWNSLASCRGCAMDTAQRSDSDMLI